MSIIMESTRNIVADFKNLTKDSPEFTKESTQIAQDITRGGLSVVQLVEQLGPLLVDTTASNRELGTWILTYVLEKLPQNQLDAKQLMFICQFYADRLKDHQNLIPAVLRGILALSNFDNFPDGAVGPILTALSHNVGCQQQQQADRMNIYRIFDNFLSRKPEEVLSMDLDFVYLVITSIDGERDPKCLIFVFDWYPKFVRKVKLKHLTEEAFEIMSCYFPVDFRMPPQDPDSVSRELLAEKLAPCLCAIPEFAEFCLPLALEKLNSSLEIAKLDALRLLEIGCSAFEVPPYTKHSTEIWSQIHKELLTNKPKPSLEESCHKTLTAVIGKLSENPQNLSSTLKDICDTVKGNLMPESKLFENSSKLLLTVMRGSEFSARFVAKEIVPLLTNTCQLSNTSQNKTKLLKVCTEFATTYCRIIKGHPVFVDDSSSSIGTELRRIPVLCIRALGSIAEGHNNTTSEFDSLHQAAFQGLADLLEFLPPDILTALCANLHKLVVTRQPPHIRSGILECFRKLARFHPDLTRLELIDKIPGSVDLTADLAAHDLYLDALTQIACLDQFRDFVIGDIMRHIEGPPEDGALSIKCLRTILEQNEFDQKIQSALLEKNTIDLLVSWPLRFHKQENTNHQSLDSCLENLRFVIKSIVGFQTVEIQQQILNRQLAVIDQFFLKDKTTNDCRTYILLLDAVLSRLRPDLVKLTYHYIGLIREMAQMLTNDKSCHDDVRDMAAQLLGNLLNKCSDDDTLNFNLDNFQQCRDVTILTWITKALVMRNHSKSDIFISKLIDMLKFDKSVAASFSKIMNDSYDSLSDKSYCNRTLLYRQKFFVVASKKLNESYKAEYVSYLSAIGYLLEFAPKQAILAQFTQNLKLVTLCLEQNTEPEVLMIVLRILREFVADKEKCVEDHLDEFLTRLLRLSTFDKAMNIRILALQCLKDFPANFPVYKLVPLKKQVVAHLGKCVDDRKRLVRKEAVEARSCWYLLDAPI